MNRKLNKYVVGLIAVLSGVLTVNAQIVTTSAQPGIPIWNSEDTAPVFRVKYNGSATTASISNSATTVVVTDGAVATTITPSGATQTAGATLAAIAACTNAAGALNFQVELLNALTADVVSNTMLAGTANVNLLDGKWHEVVKWDTSAILHFDCCSYGDGSAQRWLNTIYGQPGGTGNLTLDVYIDGTKVWEKLILLPIYTQGAVVGGTNASTTVQDWAVNENLGTSTDYGILVPAKSKCLIRATRATTATTGGLGGMITSR